MRDFLSTLCVAATLSAQPIAASAGPVLSDPEAFPYVDLPASGQLSFTLNADSPRFVFKSGESAFVAFRLPTEHAHFLVDVMSELDPPSDPRRSRVFYPTVALLSDSFLVTRLSDAGLWQFDLPELAQTDRPAYRMTVDIRRDERERYLVVYTPNDEPTRALAGAAAGGQIRVKITPIPADR